MASETAYLPEEELDETSKVSYIEWISHRLGTAEVLGHDEKNGNMSTEQLQRLTAEIIRFVRSADISEPVLIEQSIGAMHNENLASQREELHDKLKSLAEKPWDKMTKKDHGILISHLLGFSFLGDPHIGSGNGVIYKAFYSEIYESLPNPQDGEKKTTREAYPENERVGRTMEKKSLKELFEMLRAGASAEDDVALEGITVPEFQRGQQWKKPHWKNFVDSGLRNIPMPSIVLGKSPETMNQPWQVIDGNQRLSTIKKIFDEDDDEHYNALKPWSVDDQLPDWIADRLNKYMFNVEKITTNSDKELAGLYERYNDSGVRMTQAQLRLAKYHETSALHHLLLALSGGPTLANRIPVRHRLSIADTIEERSERAASLRKLLPNIGPIKPDEKKTLRKVTEKVYDLYCRIVAYSTFLEVQGSDDAKPTAKQAIEKVFGYYRDGTKAIQIVDRLDFVIKEVGTTYGDYAFLSFKTVNIKDQYGEDGMPLQKFEIGKSVHGWATQVQCAAFWYLGDDDISLLKRNPDRFQQEWYEFITENMVNARQNSKSIWTVQQIWINRVSDILQDLKMGRLSNEDSEERQRLLAEVNRVLNMPEDQRHWVTDGWVGPQYSPEQIVFLNEQLESRR